ncbi:MAG: ribosomal protein [Bacilli bacterium]|nr:ribosomal protein [Bacilli bacterium]
MSSSIITARLRTSFTKSARNKIRESGGVIANLYGKNTAPQSLFLDANAVKAVMNTGRGVIRITVEGDRSYSVIMKQIEHYTLHPNRIMHIDFHSVDLDEYIEAEVPILLNGLEQVGKAGGIFLQRTHEINIRALPAQMPELLLVDISEMKAGDQLYGQDLALPPGCNLREAADMVIVAVVGRT